ncbi:hypothetical protein LJC60_05290 [Ruminococcaceae bacterium OttesenSCG-928-D13]|nr:hypothetical protein [Ruminococcaceae bacterium OttesenSCG-928-D13]
MNNEEKILQMLEQLQGDMATVKQGQAATNARLDNMEQSQAAMLEKQDNHTKAIMNLENSVMHELKMLNELLPDALAKREAFEDMAAKVDDHDNRIFALEQAAANQ